jgi:type I restriction enzyme, S subunit
MEYSTFYLNDLADFTNGGAWKASEYVEEGISVVRVSDFTENTIDLIKCKFLPQSSYEKYSKYVLHEGDLVIATVGSHPTQPNSVVGRPVIVPKEAEGALLNQNAVRLKPKNDNIRKEYLGYLGLSPVFRNYIIANARGSANQVRMAISLLKKMEIQIPSLDIQDKIVKILHPIDKSIINNHKLMKVVDIVTENLFQEWFVRFKFPSHNESSFVKTEYGSIPKEWKWAKYSDLCTLITDGTHDTPKPAEEGYYLVLGKNIKKGFIDYSKCYKISKEDHKKVIKRSNPEKGDILFTNIGTLGNIAIVDQEFEYSIKNVALYKPLHKHYTYYLFLQLSSKKGLESLIQRSSGTSQKFLGLNVLRNTIILSPSDNVVQEFSELVKPLFLLKSNQMKQIVKMKELRKILLLSLLSGEIDLTNFD